MSKYFFPGTYVLKNKLRILDEDVLIAKETIYSLQALKSNLYLLRNLDLSDLGSLFKIHKIMFGDVYEFAGEWRKENISKGNKTFHDYKHFDEAHSYINTLISKAKIFDDVLQLYELINHLHPFREGNGRATRVYINLLLEKLLGVNIAWEKITTSKYMEAMISQDTNIMNKLFRPCLQKISEESYIKSFFIGLEASYAYEGIYFTDSLREEFIRR